MDSFLASEFDANTEKQRFKDKEEQCILCKLKQLQLT